MHRLISILTSTNPSLHSPSAIHRMHHGGGGGGGGRGGRGGGGGAPVDNDEYYKLLGVGKDADENEIKKVYKSLALQHHDIDLCTTD